MNNIVFQHYRNAKNWGDSWLFSTKMLLQGHLLTDKKYEKAIKNILNNQNENGETKWKNYQRSNL